MKTGSGKEEFVDDGGKKASGDDCKTAAAAAVGPGRDDIEVRPRVLYGVHTSNRASTSRTLFCIDSAQTCVIQPNRT